jgi:hypothetical protein
MRLRARPAITSRASGGVSPLFPNNMELTPPFAEVIAERALSAKGCGFGCGEDVEHGRDPQQCSLGALSIMFSPLRMV